LVHLDNRGAGVQALELTFVPEDGSFAVRDARPTQRARGFDVAFQQADPSSPVKVVVVSLDGKTIAPGSGNVVRFRPEHGASGGHLRLTDVKVVER
jgi:hypothetical protein